MSSSVGAQPASPMSKVTGGSVSTASSSISGSGPRPSAIRNQPWITPRWDGAPVAHPTVAGSSRMSKRCRNGRSPAEPLGARSADTHRSGSARTRSTGSPAAPSWTMLACPVAIVRPERTCSVRIVAGPGTAADR